MLRVFLSYLNDDERTISGFFDLLEKNTAYIKISTGGNIIILPWARVLKLKMGARDDN